MGVNRCWAFGVMPNGLAGVVEDDLPAAAGFLEDEREDSGGVSASGCAARKAVVAGDGGEVCVERVHFEISEGELAHLLFACEGVLIAGENVCVSVLDGFADEDGRGGIVVAAHEGDHIAAVPVGDLR